MLALPEQFRLARRESFQSGCTRVKGAVQLVAADSRYCRRRTGRCCDPTDQYMRALVSILIAGYNADESAGTAVGSALGRRQKKIMVVDQGAAARVPSAGDTANPDQLKNDLENTKTWKSWRSYSWRRNCATSGTTALNCAAMKDELGSLISALPRRELASFLLGSIFWMGFIEGCLRNKRARIEKIK